MIKKGKKKHMKPVFLIPIIAGSILLVVGGALIAIGIKNNRSVQRVENLHELTGDISNFDIDLQTADFEMKLATDGNKRVVCRETTKDVHEVNLVDGTLSIKYKDLRKWHEKLFVFDYHRNKVTVYLPADTFESFKFHASTGDVIMPHNYTFNSFDALLSTGDIKTEANVTGATKIETTTGHIYLTGMNTNSVDIKASTGSINLKDVVVTEDININVTTGAIKLDNVMAKNYTSTSSTGDVTLKNSIFENEIKITTTTGDVTFDRSDAATVEVNTTTGDVSGTFLSSKIFYAQSTTGRINVPPSTTGGLCKVNTTTGDISLSIVE